MEFKVQFEGTNNGFAVKRVSDFIGIDGVDQIRDELNTPSLDIERIVSTTNGARRDPEITISEDIARKSRHFGNVPKISVKIPPGGLNVFLDRAVKCDRDASTGGVKTAMLEYVLNEKDVLASWIDAGFPLAWDPSDVDEDEVI